MTLCWLTFWGGLLFYLGHSQPGAIPHSMHVTMSIGIVTMNVIFLIYISYKFGQEYFQEMKIKNKKKKKLKIKPMKENKEEQITKNDEESSTKWNVKEWTSTE